MKIDILDTGHFGDMFGEPIFLAASEIEEVRACPVCGDAVSPRVVAQAEGRQDRALALSQCGACGHGYLSRRPSAAWYQRYYATDWDTGRVSQTSAAGGVKDAIMQALRKSTLVRRLYRGLREAVSPRNNARPFEGETIISMLSGLGNASGMKYIPRGRVLEIGCGYGGALALFKDIGFEAVGTEASPHRVAACRARGLDVVETSIEDIGTLASRGPFDVVYSAHVFEHILDLQNLMAQLAPLVSDRGCIYIEVPHASAAEALVKFLHYPYHCHVFSASSLTRLLEVHGFRTVRVQMDVNLHVVACKGVAPFDFPQLQPQTGVAGMLRDSGAWTRETGALRMYFDDFDCEITRADDGRVVYRRPKPYATKPRMENNVAVHGREFLIAVENAAEAEPVRFVHPTPQAPIWMKFQ